MAAPVAKQKLIAEVNSIVHQIGAKEKLGTDKDEEINEQKNN